MVSARRALAIGAAAVALLLSPGAASAHDIIYFRQQVRYVEEGEAADLTVSRCCHGTGEAAVDWATTDATARAPDDYEAASGTVQFPGPIADSTVTVRTTARDGVAEPVKAALVTLSNPRGNPRPTLTYPQSSEVVILDADGPSRAAFASERYSVYSNRDRVTLEVVRLGDVSAAHTVAYETVDGTARAGEQYQRTTGELTFEPGKRRTTAIRVPIIQDFGAEDNLEFTVRLQTPEDPTAGPVEATVEIRNLALDYAKPFTDFHRPKDGATYSIRRSLYAHEAHVYADDGDGSGIKKVALALRKRMDSGACRWWNGRRFRRGPCRMRKALHRLGSQQVFAMVKRPREPHPTGFEIFRYPRLRPTVGTRVRSYRVISRATDYSNNVESYFRDGFNIRDFKLRR